MSRNRIPPAPPISYRGAQRTTATTDAAAMKRQSKIPLRIEPASRRDLLAIAEVDAAAFAWARAQYPGADYLPLRERSAEWFQRYGNRAMAKIIVARTRGAHTPIGYLLTLAEPLQTWGAHLRIVRLAVSPPFHRMGVARELVAREGLDAMTDENISFRSIYADADMGLVHVGRFFAAVGLPSVGISPKCTEKNRIRFRFAFPQPAKRDREQEQRHG